MPNVRVITQSGTETSTYATAGTKYSDILKDLHLDASPATTAIRVNGAVANLNDTVGMTEVTVTLAKPSTAN